MRQTDPLIDPNSSDPRAATLARASELIAKTITPSKILSMFSTQTAVCKTYAALSACLELGYKNPTLSELAMVAGISRAAAQYAVQRLKTAGLIATEYTKGKVGRPMIYTLAPLVEVSE